MLDSIKKDNDQDVLVADNVYYYLCIIITIGIIAY